MQSAEQNTFPNEETTHSDTAGPRRFGGTAALALSLSLSLLLSRSLVLSVTLPYVAAFAQTLPLQQQLQVLHWWKSASERKAVDLLAARLAEDNVAWCDGGIASGADAGVGADIVLKSRVLAGDAPDAAQLNGIIIGDWARLGLLREFDSVAAAVKWNKLLLPTVWSLVRPHEHVVAAPLGIHRINTLFYHRKLFVQFGIAPPRNWDEFERAAAKLQQAGVAPLAQSSEPWQVAQLFETLVLSEAGPALYRELFVKKSAAAFADARVARALDRLRALKKWMAPPLQERSWNDTARQFADGDAAMMVMGDWMKGELNAWGLATDDAFGCAAVPGTADYFLYDIDTFAMLATDPAHRAAQEKLARLAVSPTIQSDYNQLKGSVPVLRNPDLSKMDSCARTAWKLFVRGSATQVPSLVHRMAADEVTKNAIVAEVHRYFIDDGIPSVETQKRLAAVAQAQSVKTGK